MRKMSLVSLCLATALGFAPAWSQTAFITQVDSSGLLVTQENRLYARILDGSGKSVENIDPAALSVYESADGSNFVKAGGLGITAGSNKAKGISFLFLMDNSGSMYDTMSGKATTEAKDTRHYAARNAAENFLLSITASEDTVGLASFNTRYKLLSTPAKDKQVVARGLDGISRPPNAEAYTELYASLKEASLDLGEAKGRKALVVLSDGENYPYLQYAKAPHPEYGTRVFTGDEALDEALRQGVTIFAVNFGDEKDSRLADIARKSGGEVFDARNEAELTAIYQSIRERILTEVLIGYRAEMLAGDKRYVKLVYDESGKSSASLRYYYTGTVFGRPNPRAPSWAFLAMPLALLGALALFLIKFEKPSLSANLSLLYAPGVGMGTKMFNVGDRTVIGSDATADITISGDSRLEKSPVTIVKDPTTGKFTILSDEAVLVNNRKVTKKGLEPGDVINFNGTIAVFDDDETKGVPKGGKAHIRGRGKDGN
jgi:Ca-activated chloride channel family protein